MVKRSLGKGMSVGPIPTPGSIMKKISKSQKQIIAEFLTNIGVAWFAAGVISVFVSKPKNFLEIIFSVSWGIIISFLFLLMSVYTIRK